jgi:exoribonuclease R
VERKITHLKMIEYMEKFIWMDFEWRVSGLNPNWLYIELENWVEWFVLSKNMSLEFSYDAERWIFYNTKTRNTLWLWDLTKIKVVKANKEMWFLDFEIVG